MAVNPDTSTALPVLRDKNARRAFLGEAIQYVNAIGHTNSDDERQRHNVRRIERNFEPAHQSNQPQRSNRDGQQ